MNIKKITVVDIDDSKRLRPIDTVYVEELKASFTERGAMMTPIEVRPSGDGYVLVAGAHRLRAAQGLGWQKIDAVVFDGTEEEALLREIDENLVRHDLTALDRAIFVARREAVWLENHPGLTSQEIAAQNRWHATDIMSFASNSAKTLGVTAKTVHRWLDLAGVVEGLSAEVKAKITGTDIANKPGEIRAIAALASDDERLAVLGRLLVDDKARPKTVAAATNVVRNTVPEHRSREGAAFDTFTDSWMRYPNFKKWVREFIAKQDFMAAKPARGRKGGDQ